MKGYRYPRMYHVPWSLGVSSEDRVISDMSIFNGQEVVITEKMDGETINMMRDGIYGNLKEPLYPKSRGWVKDFWSEIRREIPEGWRIVGENVYAQHSISYKDLESYFLGFAIFDKTNLCLSWQETEHWFGVLEISSVPFLWEGMYEEETIKDMLTPILDASMAGWVMRLSDSFYYEDFKDSVVKCVGKKPLKIGGEKKLIVNKLSM